MAVQFYAYSSLFTPLYPEKMGTRWSREVTYAASDAFVSRLQSAHKADCRRRGGLSNSGTFCSLLSPRGNSARMRQAHCDFLATSESGRLTGCICHGGNAAQFRCLWAIALHEQQLASTHSHLLRLYNHSKWLCSLREANYFRALKTDFRVWK